MYALSDKPLHPNTPSILKRFIEKTKPVYKAFVVSITDKCNIKCDFCCHPGYTTSISDSDADRLVESAADLGFDEICFTGGEPFLRRSALISAADICGNKGVLFGIISNGYWASDINKAKDIIEKLTSCGLTRITISWDPSHGAFVPVQTAQQALDASIESGLKVTLTGSFKVKGESHETYGFKLDHLKQYKNFSQYVHPVSKVGRGLDLAAVCADVDARMKDTEMRCPSQELIELVCYDKDSLVLPCCSIYAGYNMKSLSLGDWRKESLSDLMIKHEGDSFFKLVREGGFKRIYDIVREDDYELFGRLPAYGQATSVCHFCHKIMASDIGRDVRVVIDRYMTKKMCGILDLWSGG